MVNNADETEFCRLKNNNGVNNILEMCRLKF